MLCVCVCCLFAPIQSLYRICGRISFSPIFIPYINQHLILFSVLLLLLHIIIYSFIFWLKSGGAVFCFGSHNWPTKVKIFYFLSSCAKLLQSMRTYVCVCERESYVTKAFTKSNEYKLTQPLPLPLPLKVYFPFLVVVLKRNIF